MKPQWLHIEGLRSYRDPVEINFAWLGGSGLFGICGPTGAGKSTVLDAMFLALYGDVPRNNSASEFLHPDAAAAVVELTFSISRAGAAETWRVRREWRRVKKRGQSELSQEVSPPRVELQRRQGAGWELVHDRAKDVDLAISERIVGIPMQDFRRAIVLPQGEFDRLLRAGPKDRAQLLGRVFGLARLGSPLQAAAKHRRAALDLELHELQARLQAKSETAGNVEALEAEIASARRAVSETREALREAEERATRVREAWRAAEALAKAQAESAAVGALASAAEASRTVLDAAGRADRAWPAVESLDGSLAREREERGARERAELELAAARRETDARCPALAEAEAALHVEGPKLAERQERASGALRDLEEADRREKEALAARADLKGVEAAFQVLARRRDAREARRGAAERGLAAAESELAATRVPAEERRRAAAMAEAVTELERLETELVRCREEHGRREAAVTRERDALRAAEAALGAAEKERAAAESEPAIAFDLETLARRGQELASRLEQAKGLADALGRAEEDVQAAGTKEAEAAARVATAQAALTKAAAERDEAALATSRAEEHRRRAELAKSEALRSAQAAHLAQFLETGHPCPVCGSAEHPRPARSSLDLDGPRLELDGADRFLAAARDTFAAASAAYERARSVHEAAQDALAERRGERLRSDERLASVHLSTQSFPEIPWDGGPEARRTALAAADGALGELRERYKREQKAQKEATVRRQAAEVQEAALRQRLVSARESVAAREVDAERSRSTWEAAQRALAERRPALDAALGGLEAARVREALAALSRRDQASEGLESAVKAQREALEQVAREAKEDDLERERRESERATVAARVAEADRAVSALRERIRTLAEGRAPRELLQALTAERDRLVERERQARSLAASARETAASVEARVADAVRRAERASELLVAARVACEQAFRDAGFASSAEVRAARLSDGERVPLQESVRAFDDRAARAAAMLAAARAEAGRFDALPAASDAALAEEHQVTARGAFESALARENRASGLLETAREAAREGAQVRADIDRLSPRLARLQQLERLLQGEKLVAFAADRHLQRILAAATGHLRILSADRYELVRDPEGAFAVRDRHQAGTLRPASTLSGGESFLVSLALALALSDHLQGQGSVRFDFFFLDEGFGSLDEETLATALDALERLRGLQRTIGTISHVPAMHERLPRRLVVQKAGPGGSASVRLEPAPA